MRTNTVLIRLIFIAILSVAGFILDPIGAHYAVPHAAASQAPTTAGGAAQTAAPVQPVVLYGIPSPLLSAIFGLLLAVIMILFEMRIQQASLKTLIGAGIGSMMGIVGGVLIGFLITSQESDAAHSPTKIFLTLALAFIMAYVGLMVGAAKGDYLDLSALGGIFSDKATRPDGKILAN